MLKLPVKIELFYNNTRNSDFAKNIFSLASGSAIAQVINIAASPILSRLFGPEFFGLTAMYTSILTLGCVISTLRFDAAIMVPEDDDEAIGLYQLSCISTMFFASIFFICLIIGLAFNVKILNVPNYIALIIVLVIHVFINNFNAALNIWANRKSKYLMLFYYPIVYQSISVGINLYLGFSGIKEYGLIIGSFIGGVFGSIYLVKTVSPPIVFQKTKRYKELFIKYKAFAIFQMPGYLLNNASMQIQTILISMFFGGIVVGSFSLCQTVLNLPMSIIGQSVGQAFYKKTIAYVHKNQPLDVMTWSIIKKITMVIFFPLAILMVFADKIFVLVFGSQWVQAGNFTKYLVPWMLFVFLSSILTSALFALKRQKDYMNINIITFISRIVPIIGGAFLSFNSYVTIAVMSGIGTAVSFVTCCYILHVCNVKIYKFVKLILINFLVTVPLLYVIKIYIF